MGQLSHVRRGALLEVRACSLARPWPFLCETASAAKTDLQPVETHGEAADLACWP